MHFGRVSLNSLSVPISAIREAQTWPILSYENTVSQTGKATGKATDVPGLLDFKWNWVPIMATRRASQLSAKKPGGVTGKGFAKGDLRINRTIPGPGRPPNWWRDLLRTYEEDAVHLIGATVRGARKRRRVRAVDIHAAREVLDRLHGRPTQPLEQRGDEELLEYLTREELQVIVEIFDRAQARVAAGEKPPGFDLRIALPG